MTKIEISMVAALMCCTPAHATSDAAIPKAGPSSPASRTTSDAAEAVPTASNLQKAGPRREHGRQFGTEGMLYLLLTALGGIAVALAGFLLISARPGDRDGPNVILGAVGYAMLIIAAFGFIHLGG